MTPIEANGITFHITKHAAGRAAEMELAREVLDECLTDPDEITTNGGWSKYPGNRLWCRGPIALPTEGTCNPVERIVITVLPRTREEWMRLDESGMLPADRTLRQLDHLPTEASLIAERRFRPSSAVALVELRQACEFAAATLRANPANAKARAHFDRLRVQLAGALEEAS